MLPQTLSEEDLCWFVPHVPLMTKLVDGLNQTELKASVETGTATSWQQKSLFSPGHLNVPNVPLATQSVSELNHKLNSNSVLRLGLPHPVSWNLSSRPVTSMSLKSLWRPNRSVNWTTNWTQTLCWDWGCQTMSAETSLLARSPQCPSGDPIGQWTEPQTELKPCDETGAATSCQRKSLFSPSHWTWAWSTALCIEQGKVVYSAPLPSIPGAWRGDRSGYDHSLWSNSFRCWIFSAHTLPLTYLMTKCIQESQQGTYELKRRLN